MIYRVARILCGIIHRGVLPSFGVPLRQVARCTLLPGASPTRHGEGALRPWWLCPLIPRRFSSPPCREIHPHQLQPQKTTSPTRKREKQTPANHTNLANIGLGTERVRSWYGEGLGSHPLFYFVLVVLFSSNC